MSIIFRVIGTAAITSAVVTYVSMKLIEWWESGK